MLQAFFDESYDDDIFVMAGWVASAKAWTAFSDEWQQFLDMKPSIGYFKMREAFNYQGEFKWWGEKSRNEKVRLLMGCISDHASLAVSCYMPHRKYKEIFDGVVVDPEITPYAFTLENIIKGLADHQEALGFHEKIDFIFDNEVMEKESIQREWASFKEVNPEIAHLLGDEPQFRDDMNWKPLQAADMLAGLVRDNRERVLKGLGHGTLLPRPSGTKDCPIMSLEVTESHLRNLRKQMENLRPYLTGTWGEQNFLSFLDPTDGHSFSVGSTDAAAERFFRQRGKKLARAQARRSK